MREHFLDPDGNRRFGTKGGGLSVWSRNLLEGHFRQTLAVPADRSRYASPSLHPITAMATSQYAEAKDRLAGATTSSMYEISISDKQLLVAFVAAFCLAGPLVWSFVRWLFAP